MDSLSENTLMALIELDTSQNFKETCKVNNINSNGFTLIEKNLNVDKIDLSLSSEQDVSSLQNIIENKANTMKLYGLDNREDKKENLDPTLEENFFNSFFQISSSKENKKFHRENDKCINFSNDISNSDKNQIEDNNDYNYTGLDDIDWNTENISFSQIAEVHVENDNNDNGCKNFKSNSNDLKIINDCVPQVSFINSMGDLNLSAFGKTKISTKPIHNCNETLKMHDNNSGDIKAINSVNTMNDLNLRTIDKSDVLAKTIDCTVVKNNIQINDTLHQVIENNIKNDERDEHMNLHQNNLSDVKLINSIFKDEFKNSMNDLDNKPLDNFNKSEVLSKIDNHMTECNITHINDSLNHTLGNNISIISEVNQSISDKSNASIIINNKSSNKKSQTETSVSLESDKLLLSNWYLPTTVLQEYASHGITNLFQWQVECLFQNEVLHEGKNLIYSAPTSAGKTLVAEILLMKTVLERRKKVLVILPFVSIVREKMFYLQDILGSSGVRVSGFMGSHTPPGGFQATHVAICTIEKANSLINRTLSEGTLGDIGAIIIDELHLVGEQDRGYILELLLTKVRYICQKEDSMKIQLIGMSATLPNLPLLAKWLNASLYQTDFRPIPLEEQCKIDCDIYNNKKELLRKITPYIDFPRDPDNVIQLCLETIMESCSVLIFCPTKNWCENLAQQISKAFMQLMRIKDHSIGKILNDQLNIEAINELSEQLKNCPVGLDTVLKNTIRFGCAFHHAGLTIDERDIIEGGFKNNTLRVLVATSTLSSGVNLPARRVIIRTPIFHGQSLKCLTYRQMIGRAGRMGKDTKGESILVCTKKDEHVAQKLIFDTLPPLHSCLEGGGRMKRAILEIIASSSASSQEDLEMFIKCTLFSSLVSESEMALAIENTLEFLMKYELVRSQNTDSGTKYLATPLGQACLASSLPPEDGLMLFTELDKARQCFVLDTDLHMIYLVTPYSISNQLGNIDWFLVLELWENLSSNMRRVGELVGVQESFLVRAARGTLKLNCPKMYHKMQIHRRFYTALALQELVNEVPLQTVADKFRCSRGVLQSLQQSAATFAGMVTSFIHQLGWDSMEIVISQFQHRLQFGVQRELIDLMRLPLLNGNRARAIFKAGIESLLQLATADACVIENVLYNSVPFHSENGEDDIGRSNVGSTNQIKSIWVNGKAGLTPREAAELLILHARKFMETEMGLFNINWDKAENDINMITSKNKYELNSTVQSSGNTSNNIKSEKMLNQTLQEYKKNNSLGECELNDNISSDSSLISSLNLSDKIDDIEQLSDSSNKGSVKAIYNKNHKIGYRKEKAVKKEKVVSPKSELNYKNEIIYKSTGMYTNNQYDDSNSNHIINSMKRKSESPETPEVKHFKRLSLNDVVDCSEDEKSFTTTFDELLNSQKHSKLIKRTETQYSNNLLNSYPLVPSKRCSESRILKMISKLMLSDVTKSFEDFLQFCSKIKNIQDLSVFLDCDVIQSTKPLIGKIATTDNSKLIKNEYNCKIKDQFIRGIYFYSFDTILYYLSLQNNNIDKNITLKHRLDILKIIFTSKSKCIRAYDCKLLYKYIYCGCQIEIKCKLIDPKIADWLLNSKEITFSMDQLIKTHLPNLVKHFKRLENKLQVSSQCIAQWFLCDYLYENLKHINACECFTEIEMPSVVCIAKMELNGICLNCKELQKLNCLVEDKMQKIQNDVYKLAGRRFNMSSSKEVAKVLDIFKGRKVSTNKKVLEAVNTPISNLIIIWRKLNNTLTKIIYPLLRNITSYNRLHGYFIMQTSTGRIVMSEPNIQNVPKDFAIDHEMQNLSCRSIFSARDGYCIISADYRQLEFRILTHLSEDPNLCDILKSNTDVFKSIAAQWNNISEDSIDDAMRQRTKQLIYGMIYGMGTKALAHTLNVTELEAVSFLEGFNRAYPVLHRYTKAVINKCAETGFVETINGRRRYLPNIKEANTSLRGQAERQAINTTIQGSAADISKMAMILVDRSVCERVPECFQIYNGLNPDDTEKKTICLMLHMHDELIYEVNESYAKKFAEILKDSMENAIHLRVPLPVNVKIGQTWGNIKEISV